MTSFIEFMNVTLLSFPGDELRQKIETERSEIERLEQEIAELQAIREDLYEEGEEDSSASSSEESEDEDELNDVLQQLISDNMQLQVRIVTCLIVGSAISFVT